ncbi:MAG: hypothetical protein ACTSQ8_04085 [Candidatus Helarchaeota archaeon]
MHKHGVNVRWFECPHCDYKAKTKVILNQHLAFKHDINVVWHECPYCAHREKMKQNLEFHLASKYNIVKKWYECPHPECNFKTKYPHYLKEHIKRRHPK